MSKGLVFDIDHFAVHDGNGIRTTIFLKGCPLHCVWCHSPESQSGKREVLFIDSKCTGCTQCVSVCSKGAQLIQQDGTRLFKRENCIDCGACVSICPSDALVYCGRIISAEEVVTEAAQDIIFYKNSGGGVTLTGGEVLYQPLFSLDILKGLKQQDIHTIVETSGMGSWEQLEKMIPFVNLFYFDIKAVDFIKHEKFTGASNKTILENLAKLAQRTERIILRVPLIPGYNDGIEDVYKVYELALRHNLTNIHLLAYNFSAAAKYEWLGRRYLPGELKQQERTYLDSLKNAAPEGIKVEVIC